MNETVISVSLEKEVLEGTDKMAKKENRTRSEVIEDDTIIDLESEKEWARRYAYWEGIGKKYGITEEVIAEEIRLYKEEQNAKDK
jgi:metal-responsive CopG/Arc/MetJ family transcriptional regulator